MRSPGARPGPSAYSVSEVRAHATTSRQSLQRAAKQDSRAAFEQRVTPRSWSPDPLKLSFRGTRQPVAPGDTKPP